MEFNINKDIYIVYTISLNANKWKEKKMTKGHIQDPHPCTPQNTMSGSNTK